MSDELATLQPGEHVDLDSGLQVSRREDDPTCYTLNGDGRQMTLTLGEVRTVAKLAGYRIGKSEIEAARTATTESDA